MTNDAFSKCHPAVNFLFFLGAIGFGVMIQHPLYLMAGFLCSTGYYLLLNGRKGLKNLLWMVLFFLIMTAINPLFNVYGKTRLFTILGRPYTLEGIYYGAAIAGALVVMLIWFGCYNAVLTSDKFTCLFGDLIPSLSLLLVMVLRLVPHLMRKIVGEGSRVLLLSSALGGALLLSGTVDAGDVYNSGKNAVTLSAAGWQGSNNVVSASNGKSVTVARNLPYREVWIGNLGACGNGCGRSTGSDPCRRTTPRRHQQ